MKPAGQARRVFDCCVFGGELDLLLIRLHELDAIVDRFVIVESLRGLDGAPRAIAFDPCHPELAPFIGRVRHLVVSDMPETAGQGSRDGWLRNAALRGVPDAGPSDLLILSDIDQIPSGVAVAAMVRDTAADGFAFRLAVSSGYVDCRKVMDPEPAWAVAATRRRLDDITPEALRLAIRDGQEQARIFDRGGWHFAKLSDDSGLRRGTDAAAPGADWKAVPAKELPAWLRRNRRRFRHLFRPSGIAGRMRARLGGWAAPAQPRRAPAPPVILCPYLYDHEAAEVRAKFQLDGSQTSRAELYLWQDKERIGPERAFEQCWGQFPDRDVVIIHSDMAPMPGEAPYHWYDALCGYRDELPRAGVIACNLLYPIARLGDPVRVQCAGGTFPDGRFDYLRGPLLDSAETGEGVWRGLLAQVRPVDWVTFGGVLIRREVIAACGPFDRRYEWAYVMDVDYSFEIRLRGFDLMQVPVCLQHEESRTTRPLMERDPALQAYISRNLDRFDAKWRPFAPMLPSVAHTGPEAGPPRDLAFGDADVRPRP